MRILILTSEFDPYRGGVGTYAREIASAAADLGHEVTVVAPDYGEDQSEGDRGFNFKVRRYGGSAASWLSLPRRIALVRAMAGSGVYDCVHAADWPFYLPLALSGFRGRTRCIVSFHGSEINRMSKFRRAAPVAMACFWNGWTNYVANSNFTARHLRATFPEAPAQHIKAIPLGVNKRWRQAPLDRASARARLSVPDDRFIIVSLGRITPRKGHMILAEALARLRPDIRDRIDWRIVGPTIEGDYADRLARCVARHGLRVAFAGSLSEASIRELFCAADLFCLPGAWDDQAQFEGFGLVYLEAGALGVPSIATNFGGVPDAVHHGETGWLVPPNDPAALAAAIALVYEQPDLRRRLSDGARALARTMTWARVARATYAA